MKYILLCGVIVVTFATVSTAEIEIVPLTVSIYYETHCSDSKNFIVDQLYKTFYKVQPYLILKLIPFGKATSSCGWFICQHGNKECLGNTIHNCVLHRIEDPIIQVAYLNCAMDHFDQPEYTEKTCVESSGVDVKQVEECYTSQEGYQLMKNAETETKLIIPESQFIPTIVFDNQYNNDDQIDAFKNFESTLCKKLFNHGYTDVCLNNVIVYTKEPSDNYVLKGNTWSGRQFL